MACESIQVSIATIIYLTFSLILFVNDVSVAIAFSNDSVVVLFFRRDEARINESIYCFAIVPLLSVSVFHL